MFDFEYLVEVIACLEKLDGINRLFYLFQCLKETKERVIISEGQAGIVGPEWLFPKENGKGY